MLVVTFGAMSRPRLCARPGCGRPAACTLTYDYAERTVWLRPLAPERGGPASDLCATHADRLRAPRGWALDDRRGPIVALRPSISA